MKISFLVVALMVSISISVAVGAKSLEPFRIAEIPPIGLPPIKSSTIEITVFNQPSSLA